MGYTDLAGGPAREDRMINATGRQKRATAMFGKLLMTFKARRALAELTLSGWVVMFVLGALLVFTAVLAYLGWTLAAGTAVPTSGYVALTFGVLFSLVVGIGLMALVFYSSRHDYDEPPKFVQDDTDPKA
jgi:hypothetical protein